MMMKLLIAAFVVIATIDALPVELSPEAVNQISNTVQDSVSSLNDMVSNEKAEEQLMADVKTSITSLPDKQAGKEQEAQQAVQAASTTIKEKTSQAINDEETQQKDAVAALDKVNSAITSIEQKQELGESPVSNAVQDAVDGLKQVKATLTAGTATSNTEARLKRMEEEANKLYDEASSKIQPTLGESGVLTSLGKAAKSQVTVHEETEQLKNVLRQEGEVVSAEKADEAEIGGLLKQLN